MAKLSQEELNQIRKLESKVNHIQNKFSTLADKKKYIEKKLIDANKKEINYLNDQIKNVKRFMTGSTANDIKKTIGEYENTKDLVMKNYYEKLSKVRGSFFRAEKNLGKMQSSLLSRIKDLKNPDLLKKAFQAFKKIPYKKTAGAGTALAGAAVAATTYRRYKNLERQRNIRLKKEENK